MTVNFPDLEVSIHWPCELKFSQPATVTAESAAVLDSDFPIATALSVPIELEQRIANGIVQFLPRDAALLSDPGSGPEALGARIGSN
jgi:hypothetical protein